MFARTVTFCIRPAMLPELPRVLNDLETLVVEARDAGGVQGAFALGNVDAEEGMMLMFFDELADAIAFGETSLHERFMQSLGEITEESPRLATYQVLSEVTPAHVLIPV